ncbi:hypothetical protein BKA63DRAFT_26912 [Paraphoma chrysanthemicola]|nr:hypothetical protein BKA63DRAFT_26912 [Paraphoma chrysanthemicola]
MYLIGGSHLFSNITLCMKGRLENYYLPVSQTSRKPVGVCGSCIIPYAPRKRPLNTSVSPKTPVLMKHIRRPGAVLVTFEHSVDGHLHCAAATGLQNVWSLNRINSVNECICSITMSLHSTAFLDKSPLVVHMITYHATLFTAIAKHILAALTASCARNGQVILSSAPAALEFPRETFFSSAVDAEAAAKEEAQCGVLNPTAEILHSHYYVLAS